MRSNPQRWAIHLAASAMLWSGLAVAQAPVEDGHRTPDAVLDAQQKAGMAYQEWEHAQAARLQAEREYQQAQQAHQAAQQQLALTKQQAAAAQQILQAAKIREEESRKVYDQATRAVDKTWSGDKQKK